MHDGARAAQMLEVSAWGGGTGVWSEAESGVSGIAALRKLFDGLSVEPKVESVDETAEVRDDEAAVSAAVRPSTRLPGVADKVERGVLLSVLPPVGERLAIHAVRTRATENRVKVSRASQGGKETSKGVVGRGTDDGTGVGKG